jgi:hypothetical protein
MIIPRSRFWFITLLILAALTATFFALNVTLLRHFADSEFRRLFLAAGITRIARQRWRCCCQAECQGQLPQSRVRGQAGR